MPADSAKSGQAETLSLTTQQRAVVEAPLTAHVLVTAGPGTGKTHVLIARLAYLIEHEQVAPGSEVLVLSFTRAAVYEIRTRLAARGGNAAYVRARTFDSFATGLLITYAPDRDLAGLDYDARIQAAIDLLECSDEAGDYVAAFRHIFVDEIQDLVGVRQQFVMAILDKAQGGFTLFGDPAQSIFNYTLEGIERRLGSLTFLLYLSSRFSASLRRLALTTNHRAVSPRTRLTGKYGPLLRDVDSDYAGIHRELGMIIRQLPKFPLARDDRHPLAVGDCTTAILCRTNGQALVISQKLHALGIDHVYQRAATDRVLADVWGVLLGDIDQRQIGKQAFFSKLSEIFPTCADNPTPIWALLKRLEGKGGTTLDISHIADRIRIGYIPDELIDPIHSDLVVSTVHRAKGREFDRVVLAGLHDYETGDDETLIGEEARVLYVALTRARSAYFRMDLPNWAKWVFRHNESERWVRKFNKWGFCHFEVRGADVHHMHPAGSWVINTHSPADLQDYIAAEVNRNDPVRLDRVLVPSGRSTNVYYKIMHNETPVGITNDAFGIDLFHVLKISSKWEVHFPVTLDDLRVECVDTVAGLPEVGRRAGLNPNGIWLRVRVAGLAHMTFEKTR